LRDTASGGPVTNFVATRPPADFARLYRDDGLTGGHVILLGPGNEAAAAEALGADPGGLQVGGGITAQNAPLWLARGAAKVIVTSGLFTGNALSHEKLADLVQAVGREQLVIDLSCRRYQKTYMVAINRWQTLTDLAVTPETLTELSYACSEFLVHAVDVEGLRQGIDETLVALLGNHSPRPVTYAGGVRDLADLDRIEQLGNGRVDVTVGSALDIFGGSLSYRAVVDWDRRRR